MLWLPLLADKEEDVTPTCSVCIELGEWLQRAVLAHRDAAQRYAAGIGTELTRLEDEQALTVTKSDLDQVETLYREHLAREHGNV